MSSTSRVTPLDATTAAELSDEARLAFLADIQRRTYAYFCEAADPETGFISDRGSFRGQWFSDYASSASCGFGLAAHAVASQRKWGDPGQAERLATRLMTSLASSAEHEQGFVYHFFDRRDGSRAGRCEASSIDTALMLCGVLVAQTTFAHNRELVDAAEHLYRRVDWNFLLGDDRTMSMGWTPEDGVLPHRWDSYSEGILLVLMAIGAPENAIPPSCWDAWRREPVLDYRGNQFLHYPPLFVHQYPMAFFDFRNHRSPRGRSYWQNAVMAHRAQIEFMTELGRRHPDRLGHYGPKLWGLTSSDSADGYRDWGGPYEAGRFEPDRGIDGSIVPSAAAGGLPIVPDAALQTLWHQKEHYRERVYDRYGFINAFNPALDWYNDDVIGIDTGITLVQAENLRSGGVWRAFMEHPAAQKAFKLAGFAKS